ncbi:MAG: hypothetical protein HC884_15240 [Chloroflexaceae bacterium]|nr:hypothetical protein [Chloroflexaceae bacterium]
MSSPPVSSTEQKTSLFRQPVRLFLVTVPAGVAGFLVLIDSFGAGGVIQPLAFLLINWAAVLVALALVVGLVSVAGSHVMRVLRQKEDWGYSLVLLAAMFAVIGIGVSGVTLAEEPVRRFFHAVYEPLTSSLLALLAFFSLSTIIRALHQRTRENLVIIAVALVVLVTQIPPVASLPLVTETMQWLDQYIALAGARGLLIGAAVGTLVATMRVLLGFDQPYLDR